MVRQATSRAVGALANMWMAELGVSTFMAGVPREGIKDAHVVPEWGTGKMPAVPQADEELEFVLKEI